MASVKTSKEIQYDVESEDNEHWKTLFLASFPYNYRVKSMTWKSQYEKLSRMKNLCNSSNRSVDINITPECYLKTILVRNKNARCCHPVFVSQQSYVELNLENERIELMEKVMVESSTLEDLPSSILIPSPKVTKLLLDLSMVGSQSILTYPELIMDGDPLKITIIDKIVNKGLKNEKIIRARRFQGDEGIYIWKITDDYPDGSAFLVSSYYDNGRKLKALDLRSNSITADYVLLSVWKIFINIKLKINRRKMETSTYPVLLLRIDDHHITFRYNPADKTYLIERESFPLDMEDFIQNIFSDAFEITLTGESIIPTIKDFLLNGWHL